MRPGRQPVILALVSAHFAASLVAVVPERSPIWRVPPLAEVRRFYAMHNLDQRWNMFAPPPRQHIAIMAAFQFTEGWTDLYPLDDFTATRLRGRLILDRGLFRVRSFLRPSNRDLSLTDRSSRAFYYQQLAEYFCRGDGRVAELVSVRFYLEAHTPPHFFDTDRDGRARPPPADFDFRDELYEQDCAA
jgi:hypothetical protein